MKHSLPVKLCSAAVVALAIVACTSAPPAPKKPSDPEAQLRAKLGIPAGAKTVIVFGQSSHLDIDWQRTFGDYYKSFVENILLQAQKQLQEQPRAFYSVAEVAYLEHHLAVHPEALAPLRAAAARGALHIVGGGLTSPDTLLPETELLLRDFLFGVRFSEDTLGIRPTAAWLPDSFGQGAAAPDLLSALGYKSVAFSRIDGAPTLPEELKDPTIAPKPGSTAAQLKRLGSADFIWRGTGGGSVLAHFMASPGLYCAGDNIDYDEPFQLPGSHLGQFRGDDPSFTDARIDSYVQAMRPYTKTPYMFIPVGCDFQPPKPRLIEYLDGYNKRRYPTTGVWAVAAPFDDYAALVSAHRSVLPVISGSLTPYYMGFYGSRAEIKRGARDAARPFFEAETFATALGAEGSSIVRAAEPDLELLALSDHHDFITGTSVDNVVKTEQLPLLAQTQAAGKAEFHRIAAAIAARIPPTRGAVDRVLAFNPAGITRSGVVQAVVPASGGSVPVRAVAGATRVPVELVAPPGSTDKTAAVRLELDDMPPFSWRTIDLLSGSATPPQHAVTLALYDETGAPASGSNVQRVVLSNGRVRAQWDRQGEFALTSLEIDGQELLTGRSFLVHDYQDDGGLWRIGSEMSDCHFQPLARSTAGESVEVLEDSKLEVRVAFRRADVTREATLAVGDAGLSLAITTGARETTTRTVSFALRGPANATFASSVPGGYAERPLQRVYSPTFWPAVAWVKFGDAVISLRQSTGARMTAPGQIELMAARDSRRDACELQGGYGTDIGVHRIEWRIDRATSVAAAAAAAQGFNRPLEVEPIALPSSAARPPLPAAMSLLQVNGDGIVSALKPADRGQGVIVRALLLPGPLTVHLPDAWVGKTLVRVDATERDRQVLGRAGATLRFDAAQDGSIPSVRLR